MSVVNKHYGRPHYNKYSAVLHTYGRVKAEKQAALQKTDQAVPVPTGRGTRKSDRPWSIRVRPASEWSGQQSKLSRGLHLARQREQPSQATTGWRQRLLRASLLLLGCAPSRHPLQTPAVPTSGTWTSPTTTRVAQGRRRCRLPQTHR